MSHMLPWKHSHARRGREPAKQVAEEGYAVLPEYLPRAECTSIVSILNDYYARADGIVHNRGASDERIFAAEHVAPELRAFKTSALCLEVACAFMEGEQCCLFTNANRLQKRGERPARSGGRWHRDRTKRQFKAMLYLADVTREMGPFSIFPRSGLNNPAEYAREVQQSSFAFTKVRWDDTEIEPFLDLALPRLEAMEEKWAPLAGPLEPAA